jgi:hypothetical protein
MDHSSQIDLDHSSQIDWSWLKRVFLGCFEGVLADDGCKAVGFGGFSN